MKAFEKVIVIFSLFPFIKLFNFSTDTQPTSLILILIYFGIRINLLRRLPRDFKYLLLTLLILPLPILFNYDQNQNFDLIRTTVGYFSFFFHAVFFGTLKLNDQIEKIIKGSFHVYLFASILQFFSGSVFSNIINRGDHFIYGFYGRGLTSLTPEPTMYGLTIILILCLIHKLKNKIDKEHVYYSALSFLQISFLAKSTLATILLAVYIFILYLKWIYRPHIIIPITLIIYFSTNYISKDDRISQIFSTIYENPKLILSDGSINLRISDIYYSFSSFFQNPFGNGATSFSDYLYQAEGPPFLLKSKLSRVMSFFGSILYSAGIFSLPFLYFLLKNFLKVSLTISKNKYLIFAFFLIVFTNSIQISLPIIPFLLLYEKR